MSLLHTAIRNKNAKQVVWLLRHGYDANRKDADDIAPVMVALRLENAEICEILISFGADVASSSTDATNALAFGVKSGNVACVQSIINARMHNSDGFPEFNDDFISFFYSIYVNDERVFRSILPNIDLEKRDGKGRTALMIAALLDRDNLLNELILRGSDVNARSYDSDEAVTALFYAVDLSTPAVLRTLLVAGADFQVSDRSGWTPLIAASSNDNEAAVETLLSFGANVHSLDCQQRGALYYAARVASPTIVQILLDAGAVSDAKYLQNSLHIALEFGRFNNADILVGAGAKVGLYEAVMRQLDVELLNTLLDGAIEEWEIDSALVIAARYSTPDAVRVLLARGASPNAKYRGKTSLGEAFYNRMSVFPILLYLLDAGANVNASDMSGERALSQRPEKAFLREIRLLIRRGALIDSQNIHGRTALMQAAQFDDLSVVNLLLRCGADPDIQDENGCTALIYAVGAGNAKVAQCLLQFSARRDIKDRDGRTALLLSYEWPEKRFGVL